MAMATSSSSSTTSAAAMEVDIRSAIEDVQSAGQELILEL